VGLEENPFLPNWPVTLSELMQKHGITTAGFIAGQKLDRTFNFDQGFETFVHVPCQNARKINTLFRNWLDGNKHFRFFAYLHYFEPNDPCNAPGGLRDQYVPEPLRGKTIEEHKAIVAELKDLAKNPKIADWQDRVEYLRGRYFGEIAYLDRRLEDLLYLLMDYDLGNKTVIIITGTHGQEFMEHGRIGHGENLYNESICIPLIIWGPERIIGTHKIIEDVADNASIYASVAQIMDLALDHETRRRIAPSLIPVDKEVTNEQRYAFSQTYRIRESSGTREVNTLSAVMNWRFKLIRNDKGFELYDLVEDPGETRNLAEGDHPQRTALEEQMKRFQRRFFSEDNPHSTAILD
jgi:arylsulfatase A-like enzyme